MQTVRKSIRVIDQTLREGMQFHGLVFSFEQRLKIMEFQEMLGVDVCQAGYPSAMDREADIVTALAAHARSSGFKLRTAALGRALPRDAAILVNTGVDELHFHVHIPQGIGRTGFLQHLDQLKKLFARVKNDRPKARISLAVLDMGRTDPELLEHCVKVMDTCPDLEVLSLPDTSGIMAPNQVHDTITPLARTATRLDLSVHCHNDMGMATANTVTGITAGADILEAAVLGIGERNGIADLFTTARMLHAQGFSTRLDLDNIKGFKAYYTYVNAIVLEQTGIDLMDYRCPIFGAAVRTHVAGTHAGGDFGTAEDEAFFLNPLCGKGLVKKYLEKKQILFQEKYLGAITRSIKKTSMDKGRTLTEKEVVGIVRKTIAKPLPI